LEANFSDFVLLFQTILWIILIIVVAIVLRSDIVLLRETLRKRLEGGGSVRIGGFELGNLQKEVKEVRQDLNETERLAIRVVMTMMGPSMYQNLKKIASKNFGSYQMQEGLERELLFLRDLGYIRPINTSIRQIPKEGTNLSDYIEATETGEDYVALREGSNRNP
jgi:hypothetical protein